MVSKLRCPNCETAISGQYPLPALLMLPPEEQNFIYQFILAGGSLKKMAQKENQSYPTVRNRLDDIIEKLQEKQDEDS
jgi:hypothetical protein